MEQQIDFFTQKKYELLIEMAAKKLQKEIDALKETSCSQAGEIVYLKKKIERMESQPQEDHSVQTTLGESKKTPITPSSGNYNSEDVSIEKFFYFGRK